MPGGHTFVAKLIHWTFIPLYAYGIFKQVDNISQLEDFNLLIFESFFAAVFLLIVIIRFSYMRRVDAFEHSQVKVHWLHLLMAKTVHRSMYAVLVLLPLSGLVIAALFHNGIKDGIFQDIALGIHEFSATMSYILIATHVSAAIYSRVKGEGVWSSMVPMLKEDGPSKNKYVQKIAELEESVYEKVEQYVPFSKKA